MGGNAIKTAIRLTSENYFKVVTEISSILKETKFKVIPAYFQKPDFGDMDILFPSQHTNIPNIIKMLNATEIVRNGEVTSIGYQTEFGIFQLDLISIPEQFFDFAFNYFSWNDCSNLMGRVAHRLGFKFGHNGFYYVLREPGNNSHVLQEILISTSFKKALEFLEFDYSTYLKGFQTLEDIFKFVIANPYFNKEIYLLENRNAVSRVRDSKRKTYNLFLQYIEHLDTLPSTVDKHVLREKYLQLALDTFPMFKAKYAQTLEKLKIKQEVKEKFNGTLVQTITGLTGKELGNFIMTFKSSFGNENDFTSFVLNSSPDVISSTIKSFSY